MAYTPYDSVIPGADIYSQADVVATNAYNKALAQVNQNRLQTLTSYGYLGDINPTTGVVDNVRVDPNNLYGKLQELFHNQALEDRSAQFATEDRGIHGGLANQAASELKYEHGAQRTQLGSDFASALSGYQQAQDEAAYQRDQALYQAELEQLQLAIANGDFNPPTDGGGSDGGGGGGGPAEAPTRKVGGITIPDNAYWQIKGIPGPGTTSAKKTALKKILGGGGGARPPMMV